MLAGVSVREEENVVQGHVCGVRHVDFTDLRTVLASFADRKNQIATASIRKLVRNQSSNLIARRKVLSAVISP